MKKQNIFPQTILIIFFFSATWLVFGCASTNETAAGANVKPPHYGVFFKQNGQLVELAERKIHSIPVDREVANSDAITETKPVIVIWQNNVDIQYLKYFKLGKYLSQQIDVKYNAVPKDDGVIEITSTSILGDGAYCVILPDPMAVIQPGWCFRIGKISSDSQNNSSALPVRPTPIKPTQLPVATLTNKPSFTNTPAPTYTPVETPTNAPTQISSEMQIPLASQSDPTSLSKDWSWFPGESESSNFKLSPETGLLTLISGPSTDLWNEKKSAPRVEYEITGDFHVQVTINFNPAEQYQLAGLGLRSAEDPNTWVTIRRGCCGQVVNVSQTLNNRSESLIDVPYAKKVSFLRIDRVGETLSFYASENGINWIAIKTNFVYSLPSKVIVFLYVYSTTQHGVIAEFSDFKISPPLSEQVYQSDTPISFSSVDSLEKLNGGWGWFPGGSVDSAFVLKNENLTLISGPGTDLWGSTISAPRMEYPVSGNFELQVRMDFDPNEQWQTAGLGIRPFDNSNKWVAFRRYCCGQGIDVSQTLNSSSSNVVNLPYAEKTIYFRIKRIEPLITFYFSTNGTNWNTITDNFVMGFSEQARVFLFVYSTSGKGIDATFSELKISRP